MRPRPIIYAPTIEARAAVMRAIYQQGWRFAGNSTCDRAIKTLSNPSHDNKAYPWIRLYEDGQFYVATKNLAGHALINSPAHLISYCKTLEQKPRVFQPEMGFV